MSNEPEVEVGQRWIHKTNLRITVDIVQEEMDGKFTVIYTRESGESSKLFHIRKSTLMDSGYTHYPQ